MLAWGWSEFYQDAFDQLELGSASCCPGRVLTQREDTFCVQTQTGSVWARSAGVLFHRLTERERPGVGDWVVLEPIDCPITDEQSSMTVTHSLVAVLPRASCFIREAPGGRGEAQVVATNVDKIFVVNPADDINLNRIERLAVAIASGGAEPAVILSKGDLVESEILLEGLKSVRALMKQGLEVFPSARAQDRCPELRETFASVLLPHKTYALVGASGVGKSTLVNALLDESRQETGDVREGDHKGRHVTTFREVFPLSNGALLIDTPGVREFAMWSQGEGIGIVFSDIEELAEQCRFSDCSHSCEPGCCVQQALTEGSLTDRRVSNWRSLKQELVDNVERQENRQARRDRSSFRRKVKRDDRFSR